MQTAARIDLGAGGAVVGGRRVIPARTGRPGLPAAAQGAYGRASDAGVFPIRVAGDTEQ
jgi:hypothetical protein